MSSCGNYPSSPEGHLNIGSCVDCVRQGPSFTFTFTFTSELPPSGGTNRAAEAVAPPTCGNCPPTHRQKSEQREENPLGKAIWQRRDLLHRGRSDRRRRAWWKEGGRQGVFGPTERIAGGRSLSSTFGGKVRPARMWDDGRADRWVSGTLQHGSVESRPLLAASRESHPILAPSSLLASTPVSRSDVRTPNRHGSCTARLSKSGRYKGDA